MVVLAVAVGCGADKPVTGTLVYSEKDTRNVRLLDLETGSSRLVDGGRFGSVSIAPDAMHVAYEGVDRIMKVADRAGTMMAPRFLPVTGRQRSRCIPVATA